MSETTPDTVGEAAAGQSAATAVAPAAEAVAAPSSPAARELSQLPAHTRSLLRIAVPVSVVVASQHKSVQEVVELVPGAIIKFDKSCQDMLDLTVGDQRVAEGEVVKVGDRYGLRISRMVLPDEHFVPLAG